MAKLNVENLTIVMNDQRPAPQPVVFTVRMTRVSPEATRAKELLAQAIDARNGVLRSHMGCLKEAHDRVLLLRSVLADLESGV